MYILTIFVVVQYIQYNDDVYIYLTCMHYNYFFSVEMKMNTMKLFNYALFFFLILMDSYSTPPGLPR